MPSKKRETKKTCDHFWELVFPVKDWDRPLWKCMNCSKTRRAPIPIIDVNDFPKEGQRA